MSLIGKIITLAEGKLPSRVFRVRGSSGSNCRKVLAVRYPWAGWGASDYAHRSLVDKDRRSGLSVEPTPSRQEQARRILNIVNSNRLVLEARFPTRAETAFSRSGGGFNQRTWFEPVMYPKLATTGNQVVAPMSSTSAFLEIRDVPGCETYNGKACRVLARENNLTPIMEGGFIGSNSTDTWDRGPWAFSDERTRISGWHRKCTRICVYRNINAEALSYDPESWGGFDASSPDFIGRHKANWEFGGDDAYEPWGFTDILPHNVPGSVGGLTLRYNDYHFSPYDPAPPGYGHGGDGPVNANSDVPTLSSPHIMYMFGHFCRPWLNGSRHMSLYYGPFPGEHSLSDRREAFWPIFFPVKDKKITIVVEAVFYGYTIMELEVTTRPPDHTFIYGRRYHTIERGYGGAYGRAFIIF